MRLPRSIRRTRNQGELGNEFTLVDVQIGTADTASLDFDLYAHGSAIHLMRYEDGDCDNIPRHRSRGERVEGPGQRCGPQASHI